MAADTMSVADAAAKLGVSAGTVRKLIDEGRIRGIRISATTFRVPVSAIDAFIAGVPEAGPVIDHAGLAGMRVFRDRTVDDVADAVGVEAAVIEAAEAGSIRLAKPLLDAVCRYLDVPVIAVVADAEVGS